MFGYIASILVSVAYLPQAYQCIKTKSAGDVSAALLVLLKLGMAFWILHALKIKDTPLLISSGFSLIQISIVSWYKFRDLT